LGAPVALFATANWVHIPFEEAKMRRQFGTVYDDYVARVRRWIGLLIAALHESAFGTKRTWRSRSTMSAFGGKADIGWRCRDVCF
jgi:hypothetical protein